MFLLELKCVRRSELHNLAHVQAVYPWIWIRLTKRTDPSDRKHRLDRPCDAVFSSPDRWKHQRLISASPNARSIHAATERLLYLSSDRWLFTDSSCTWLIRRPTDPTERPRDSLSERLIHRVSNDRWILRHRPFAIWLIR